MNDSDRLDGIAFRYWSPRAARKPAPAVLILHGAGSSMDNHAEFARAAAANGFAALAFDNRGHGLSDGKLGSGLIGDVDMLVRWLGVRGEVDSNRIVLRGSSMGGTLAIYAAALLEEVAGVIAICPAPETHLMVDLRRAARGEPPRPGSALEKVPVDAEALLSWLEEHPLAEAIAKMAPRPLFLVHATGDDQIPYTESEKLFESANEPKRLLLVEGGNHRSAQHDPEVHFETLRWIDRQLMKEQRI